VVTSAAGAGVGHVVKITSKASADSPIARRRDQAEIENGLIASGLGYTLLRNNAYMQNFLMLAPAIAKTSSFGSSTGDGRVGVVDTRDVAAVAAEIAASPSARKGKTYWPTGPESLSYADAAAVLSEVLGRAITFHPLTFDEQKQALVDVGVPEHIAAMNAQAVTLFAEGDSDWVTDDVPSILGRPARTFEQFVIDHAAAFSWSSGNHGRGKLPQRRLPIANGASTTTGRSTSPASRPSRSRHRWSTCAPAPPPCCRASSCSR
jgi:hypothetical protein